jgi:selenide,water dikinase
MQSTQLDLPIHAAGGCAAKLPAELLDRIISQALLAGSSTQLLCGPEAKDDAAIYKINERTAIALSVDYSMPFCKNARDFGYIAAANALSDIYAMGARPRVALSILEAPDEDCEQRIMAVLRGAGEACVACETIIAGGHSLSGQIFLFGLSVVGFVAPDVFVRNSTALADNIIVLCKPLGFGLYARASESRLISDAAKAMAYDIARKINTVGADLAEARLVTAMTDVTGFGLLGHLLEMATGSKLRAVIDSTSIPSLPDCEDIIGHIRASGAGARNTRSARAASVSFHTSPWIRTLITEPETNGGLLLAVNKNDVGAVLDLVRAAGFSDAAPIGYFCHGPPGVDIR